MGEPATMKPLLRYVGVGTRTPPRNDSAIIALVRNEELDGIINSMRQMEANFNAKFRYPWIFFNDKPFSEEFKRRTRLETRSTCRFGKVSA
jgi:mannosyltransferase